MRVPFFLSSVVSLVFEKHQTLTPYVRFATAAKNIVSGRPKLAGFAKCPGEAEKTDNKPWHSRTLTASAENFFHRSENKPRRRRVTPSQGKNIEALVKFNA